MILGNFIRKIFIGALKRLPLDATLCVFQRCSCAVAGLILFRDWSVQAYGWPQFFKHQISLNRWVSDPSQWSFAARGVFARENMVKGCRVLDLCCGDGFYSYFFFSDIAQKVDAVDKDGAALCYAKRYHASSVVEYHAVNIGEEALPDGPYDVVVWNAAISYFTVVQIRHILKEIVRIGTKDVVLCGMEAKAYGYPDHKAAFQTSDDIKDILKGFFRDVTVREAQEATTVFYFQARGPVA